MAACSGCTAGWPLAPMTDYTMHVWYTFDLEALRSEREHGRSPRGVRAADYVQCDRKREDLADGR